MSTLEISQFNTLVDSPEIRRDNLIAPSNRYIVVRVGDRLVTFPDVLVSEIMIVDRNAILALPFYEIAIIGVIHHQATITPLLLLRLLLGEQRALITETLTVVKLSKIADTLSNRNLGGVGIIVDKVIGSLTADEYHGGDNLHSEVDSMNLPVELVTEQKKINQTVANRTYALTK
jgi:chemotaxis signal transduction protein